MIRQELPIELAFAQKAGQLNDGFSDSSVDESLMLLAQAGWLGYGVPEDLGGSGGTLLDAVEAIASVSEQCLTSGFVFWCQRTFIQYLINSDNPRLKQEILPTILQSQCSGATGLSNAMKHLAGIERLRVEAVVDAETVTLNGFLPWVSNLQLDNFIVAVAAQTPTGETLVVAVPFHAQGLTRGKDLQLLGLQASWTSTLHLNGVRLHRQWIISENAQNFLPSIRSAFLLLQCGLPLGVARQAIQEALQNLKGTNHVLSDRLHQAQATLCRWETQLRQLTTLASFDLLAMRQLFITRIALTRLALDAVGLELEAKGGSAYMKPSATARRWREVAFLPVLTPSLVQLETELQRHALAEGVL